MMYIRVPKPAAIGQWILVSCKHPITKRCDVELPTWKPLLDPRKAICESNHAIYRLTGRDYIATGDLARRSMPNI